MRDIKLGDVVQVQGKIVAVIEEQDGFSYKVAFSDSWFSQVTMPAYRVFPVLEGELHE